MIEILCFGDSNTYGFTPDWKHRYGRDIRYPGVLQALLGDGYYVAEDGLIGRTAAFPDSNRDGRSALETLPLSIESHGPVQYIILMLGTNDCKIDKTRSAEDVGAGMDKLVRLVIGMLPAWTKILLVAPPPLGPAAPQRAGCPPPPAAGRPGRGRQARPQGEKGQKAEEEKEPRPPAAHFVPRAGHPGRIVSDGGLFRHSVHRQVAHGLYPDGHEHAQPPVAGHGVHPTQRH